MPLPLTRDVVLVGGGHTHALVLRRFGMRPVPGARLTLINPGPTAAYSGMLPGHVAGHYSRAALDIDLVRLARFAGARIVLGSATGLDPAARTITVPGRPPIGYDLASIDIGITSEMPDLPGFADHAVPAKPLGRFAERWQAFVARVVAGELPARVAVIGAGVAGVELALAMAHRLRRAGLDAPEVTLVEARTALSGLGGRARAVLRRRLLATGVTLRENARILKVSEGNLDMEGGAAIPFGFCVGTAGTKPHPWLAHTALARTDGFLDVDDQLRSTSHRDVYAVGDCAHLTFAPRPKAGVYAVRQAPVLAHNLRADLTGSQRRRYRPQRDYLKLVSLGRREALVERGPVTLAAPWLWSVKDRIDRAFMDGFGDLPAMPAPRVPAGAARGVRRELADGHPLCGGCGAKVGPAGLRDALAALPAPLRPDIVSPPGDDAAILVMGDARQAVSVDHLRAVVEDPWLMGRIAAVHAMGDIWAMGASPQAALATLILPRMVPAMQERMLAEITDAAAGAFAAAGADLVGGHTTLGTELTLGFTVTGLCSAAPLTLAGARPGDALILTRPIGTGVLLAAEMRGKAAGADMARLYDAMIRPQGAAAAALAARAHAMTDVTGFGLAGHLLGMLQASGAGATLDLHAVRFHPGATAMAARGIRSTLHAQNHAHAAHHMDGFAPAPETDLLFDPQTCGGLLAAVPPAALPGAVAALDAAGEHAARIGTITERAGDGAPRIARA